MEGQVTFTNPVPIASTKTSSGVYITSYMVMTPFWSMGITSSHITTIVVEELAFAVTFSGGPAGTGEERIFCEIFIHMS